METIIAFVGLCVAVYLFFVIFGVICILAANTVLLLLVKLELFFEWCEEFLDKRKK